AFGITSHLVVWSEQRGAHDANIYGLRVGPDGQPLDVTSAGTPAPFVVNALVGDQVEPSVAFDGTNWLVVWSNGADLLGARVTQSGAVLDAVGVPLCTASGAQRRPRVAFGGTRYVVVWTDYRAGVPDVYATRVTPTLAVLDGEGVPVAPVAGRRDTPSIAFDGTA